MKGVLYPLIGILHLSSDSYSALSSQPEFAALASGFVASFLIGLAYVALPAFGIVWLTKGKIGQKTKRQALKLIGAVVVVFFAAFVLAELLASAWLMMVASGGLVLTLLAAGGIVPALALAGLAKRRKA
jgi:hypothetical protein